MRQLLPQRRVCCTLSGKCTSTQAQDSLTLSRNGFHESASRLASSKYPSSKSLPTHLKYSQRNDASGNWYTCSFGTHKPNLSAEINADRIAGLRSRTLSGHPDNAVRALILSERLRNLEPRLRSSKAFFSPDCRFNDSNETPMTIPVKKTKANLNQRCWPRARRLSKTVVAIALRKNRRGHAVRIGEDVFLQPFFEDRRDQRDQQKTPNPKQKPFKPFGHRALLVSTLTQPTRGEIFPSAVTNGDPRLARDGNAEGRCFRKVVCGARKSSRRDDPGCSRSMRLIRSPLGLPKQRGLGKAQSKRCDTRACSLL